MIIDMHAHIYPDPIASKTVAAICERSRISAHSDGTLQGLLKSMEKAGVDLSIVSFVATRPRQVGDTHQWLSEIRDPKISAFATMHPDLPPSLDEMRILKMQGFRGFKVHPDYQGFFVEEQRMYPFYEAAQAERMPVLFHAGMDRGLPEPVHATPRGLAAVHKAFPGLVMIAAHMGGEFMSEEAEEHLLGKDIYLDTSFVLRRMPVEIVERFFRKHPLERFLFGTDSPWTDQAAELRLLLSFPFLSDEGKELVTGRNAADLLGL